MPIFILRRSAEAFVTLFVLTMLIFALARLAGDPVPLVLGTEATKADIEFYRRQGADVLPDWRICRVSGEALERLALSP